MQRVGMIFNQSTAEKEYIMNDEEVYQMCELSAQVGEHCVVAVFSMLEEEGQVWCCGAVGLLRCLALTGTHLWHAVHAERGAFRSVPVLESSGEALAGGVVL